MLLFPTLEMGKQRQGDIQKEMPKAARLIMQWSWGDLFFPAQKC